MPEITRKLYDLTAARRIDEARDLQYKLLRLFDAMIYSADFPEGFRAALRLRGVETGRGRQPLSAGQQVDLQTVSDNLQCLLAEEGFSDEPLTGCPPRHDDTQDVDRIVRAVVDQLRRRGLAGE